MGGEKSKAEAILNGFLKKREGDNQYVPAFFLALAYLGLGDRTRALAEIKEAIRERSHWVLFLRTEPMFDPLRGKKRFESLLKTV